jgi:hypothetical protein
LHEWFLPLNYHSLISSYKYKNQIINIDQLISLKYIPQLFTNFWNGWVLNINTSIITLSIHRIYWMIHESWNHIFSSSQSVICTLLEDLHLFIQNYSPLKIGTMSGFICARYTIAHLIKQINQAKLHGGEEKSKVMRNKTGHDC